MPSDDSGIVLPDAITQLINPVHEQADVETVAHMNHKVGTVAALDSKSEGQMGGRLTLALIDSYRLSRECLATTLEGQSRHLSVVPFKSVEDYIAGDSSRFDLVIYYPHGDDATEAAVSKQIAMIQRGVTATPVIVLSDAEEADQTRTIREMLSSGAHGFIPTRSTSMSITLAAIRFVRAGGTFAPLDLLLTSQPEREKTASAGTQPNALTARQMAVLAHLQQGKANKIIAHELKMSESTVKVHVRAIMRKMGATNRTQAAYKAQQLAGVRTRDSIGTL
ncbi:MAG TPA: response regulator transcription factor [Rhodopila sp.]|nr:response regulator transcription factor [Rhodopila sp.]